MKIENCVNCIYSYYQDSITYCKYDKVKLIPHPFLMGGSKKCKCYKKFVKHKEAFKYPEPDDD